MKKSVFLILFIFQLLIFKASYCKVLEFQQGIEHSECCEISLDKPGTIREISFLAVSDCPQIYDMLLLQIFWDGDPEPSVSVPLGALFGIGFGNAREYQQRFISCEKAFPESPGILSFKKQLSFNSARISISNIGPQRLRTLFVSIDLDYNSSGSSERFHANYMQQCCAKNGSIVEIASLPKKAKPLYSIQYFLRGPEASVNNPILYTMSNDLKTSKPLTPDDINMDSRENRSLVVYQKYDTEKTLLSPVQKIFSAFYNPKGRKDCSDYGAMISWVNNRACSVNQNYSIDWVALHIEPQHRVTSTPQIARKILNNINYVKDPQWNVPEKLYSYYNIAPYAHKITASGYLRPYQKPKWAIDGRLDTKWCVLSEKNKYPTLDIDLGRNRTLSGFILYGASSSIEFSLFNPIEYNIYIKPEENKNWLKAVHFSTTPNKSAKRDYDVHLMKNTKTARYIRLEVIHPCELDDYVRIQELAVLSPNKS